MSWMRLDSSFRTSHKVRRLARTLGVDMLGARGLLVTLWTWVLEHAPDGSLERLERCEVEDAAEWMGEPGRFVDAMEACELLDRDRDGGLVVHDWMEYAGSFKEAQRKKKQRRKRFGAKRARIYVARSKVFGMIKIGFSEQVGRRMLEHKLEHKHELELLLEFDGTMQHERDLHERFAHLSPSDAPSHEWFIESEEILAWIKTMDGSRPGPDRVPDTKKRRPGKSRPGPADRQTDETRSDERDRRDERDTPPSASAEFTFSEAPTVVDLKPGILTRTRLNKFVEAWNDGVGRSGVPRLNPSSDSTVKRDDRWRKCIKTFPNPEQWGWCARALAASPHHRGQNSTSWRADLGWLIERGQGETLEKWMNLGEQMRTQASEPDPSLPPLVDVREQKPEPAEEPLSFEADVIQCADIAERLVLKGAVIVSEWEKEVRTLFNLSIEDRLGREDLLMEQRAYKPRRDEAYRYKAELGDVQAKTRDLIERLKAEGAAA